MGRDSVHSAVTCGLVLVGLVVAQRHSFLLFHCLAEGFSIVIAFSVFVLAWNSRWFNQSHYLCFIGIAYLFVGGFDLLHTLSYKGMGVFHGYDSNQTVQFWIAARYTQAVSLALAFLWVSRKPPDKKVFWAYATIFILILLAVFDGRYFPDCFLEGKGLTRFKIISEYAISLILLSAMIGLAVKRRRLDPLVRRLLTVSIILTILSEIAFTYYVDLYGLSNQIGHYFKIASFYLIYRAIIQTGLTRPYLLLFRELQQSRDRLQRACDQLESRVAERTAELCAVTRRLKDEIKEREWAQQHLLKSNRVLKMLSECNQCLARETDEEALLNKICRNIVDFGGFPVACLFMAPQDPSTSPKMVQAGFEHHVFEEVFAKRSDGLLADDLIGPAMATGQAQTVKLRPNGTPAVWRSAALKAGMTSVIILPLRNNGDIMGSLMIFSDKPDDFDLPETGSSLMELARDAALGITLVQMKQRRHAVEAERLLLSTAIEQAGECITIVNRNGLIEYINHVPECLEDLEPQAAIGRHLPDLLCEHDKVFFESIFLGVKKGQTWKGRIKGKTKSGEKLIFSVTLSPLRNPSLAIEHYLGIVRDITRECQMEQQLVQSQKMEAIGTLAGGIAHDFNNILSAINGFTELVLYETEKNTKTYENLREILSAGQRARELVKQILAFSRQTRPARQPVVFKQIIQEAVKLLRSSLPSTIEIRQDLKSHCMVMADPTQLHQVVMNLCTNAAHAMREKGGVMTLALTDEILDAETAGHYEGLGPGHYVKATITDTGHGMSPEIMRHIFEPFFTTKQLGEGTGMGLSVVHGIVLDCGGTITVSSEPFNGTSFSVFLPVLESTEEPKRMDPLVIPLGGNEHILFVDDEPALANMGRQVLQSLGYQVTTRTNGSEALSLIKTQPDRFDLVFTDMTMPKMTGEILAREIMAIRPDLPVILSSGFSTRIDEERSAELGIRAYVRKPFLREHLAQVIREVLEKKQGNSC